MALGKTCSVCSEWKEWTQYGKDKRNRDGHYSSCRSCHAAAARKSYAKDPKAAHARNKAWKERNPAAANAHAAKYQRNKRARDIQHRLKGHLRSRLYKALRDAGTARNASAVQDLGCTVEQLRAYLESKFLPGMTWENRHLWHIDHIRPLASFDLTDPEQQRQACHYTNLQPLWAEDNLRKGASLGMWSTPKAS